MLKNLTIGQHYPVESKIHDLDPRVKIMVTLIFIVSLFLINKFQAYLLVFVFLGLVIKMSHVPLKMVIRGLKPILINRAK